MGPKNVGPLMEKCPDTCVVCMKLTADDSLANQILILGPFREKQKTNGSDSASDDRPDESAPTDSNPSLNFF